MKHTSSHQSQPRLVLKDFRKPFQVRKFLFVLTTVARVRPRTSKGITDLLLPRASPCFFKKQVVSLRSLHKNTIPKYVTNYLINRGLVR